jgi:hypothetical protein
MQGLGARRVDPELKQMVAEASRALALLDADRLEELARACQALNRGHLESADLARQAREAAGEMAIFARVLDATRSNLTVMNRLRELHQGRIDYADAGSQPSRWALPEVSHGDH